MKHQTKLSTLGKILGSCFLLALLLNWTLPQARGAATLNGAGATFPYPIYSKWFAEYNKKNPQVRFNYQSIGSGGGIQQLLSGTVDFGASDVPMQPNEEKKSASPVLHIPTVLGAVAVVYNLEEVKEGLKLTGEVLAKIYMGQVSKWNDPLIQDLNKGLKLPNKNILVVHRSDGSGTSAVFTEYLSQVSGPWKTSVGSAKAVKWPTGIGGKGNEGVTGIVKQTKGTIGYVELAYAIQNKMSLVALKNKDGQFQAPTLASISAAAQSLGKDADEKASIVNAPGKSVYPLASTTYLLIPSKGLSNEKKAAMKDFLTWALSEGQNLAADLHYAPLPASLQEKMKSKVQSL